MIQLARFMTAQGARFGCLVGGTAFLSRRYRATAEALDAWSALEGELRAGSPERSADWEPLNEPVHLLSPLEAPRNIYFAGANYRDHVAEMRDKLKLPLDMDPKGSGEKPWHCLKATGGTVVGPEAVVALPSQTPLLDWELELAVVIGRPAFQVGIEEALSFVAGYTVANDLSDRARVGRAAVETGSPFKWDWIGQKSFDGSCPLGPAITPAFAIGDVHDLAMRLWVNDEIRQDSNTGQMMFDVADQISHLSQRVTLRPGDVILTGTPSGVGMATGQFLRPGDIVRQWIQHIGEFRFSIA